MHLHTKLTFFGWSWEF
jgi:hypothetical protein